MSSGKTPPSEPRGMTGAVTPEWTRYWAHPRDGVELLRARYVRHRYDWHMHESYAFGLVEAGFQAFSCRGTHFHSTGGSIFAINPGDAHDGEPAGDGGFLYRMIYVTPEAMKASLGDDALPLFRTAMFFDDKTARALAAAHVSFARAAGQLEREHCLSVFLKTVVRRHARVRDAGCQKLPARRSLEEVREFMHAHFREDVQLDTLAAIAGLGRHHLTRSFTRRFGIAPHRYLTHLRLADGRTRLSRGEAIADVATGAGFADQSHFHRRFKRAFGITPGQFQRAVTNVQ